MLRSTPPAVLAVWLAASTACDRAPATPVEPSGSTASEQLVAMTVTGPKSVDVGGKGQFRAIARFADGSSRDVTSEARWEIGPGAVLAGFGAGGALGLQPGDGRITASLFGLRSPTTEVIVVPAGTFRLAVRVVDADGPYPTSVPRAVIEVTAEDGTSVPGVPASYGARFYAVRGRLTLRVSQPFYVEHLQTIDLVQHEDLELRLRLSGGGVNLAGAYTLRIDAAPSCASALGPAGMSRSYAVALRQDRGGGLVGELSGATFPLLYYGEPRWFGGWVGDAGAVMFDLRDFGLGDSVGEPTIVEALPDGRFYAVRGLVAAAITDLNIAGTLDGDVRLTPTPVGGVGCQSADHRFTLTRR